MLVIIAPWRTVRKERARRRGQAGAGLRSLRSRWRASWRARCRRGRGPPGPAMPPPLPCCRSPCSAPTTGGRCRPNTRTCARRSGCCSACAGARFARRSAWPATWSPPPATACSRSPASARPAIGDFWFLRNYDAVRDIAHIAGHANGTAALNVMSGSMSLNVRPPIEATRDWALVRLARPACTQGRAADTRAAHRSDPEGGRRQARVPDLLSSRLHAVEARLRPALRRRQELRALGMERHRAGLLRSRGAASCTPATPAAPPRARRCCSTRTAVRRSSASTSAPTCSPRC